VPYRLRPYLEQSPTAGALAEVLRRLGAMPWEICRTGEPQAVALGMADWPRDHANVRRWIEAMAAAPQPEFAPRLTSGYGLNVHSASIGIARSRSPKGSVCCPV
jgi:hypothetical protein